MLQTGSRALALDAANESGGNLSCQHGIFGIIFVVAAAQCRAHQVDAGCQQHVESVVTHLFTDGLAQLVGSVDVERGSHVGLGRNLGGDVGLAVPLTRACHVETMGAVGQIGRLDAEARDVARTTSGARELHFFAHSHTAADEQVDLLFGSHGGNDLRNVVGGQLRLSRKREGSESHCSQHLCSCVVFHFLCGFITFCTIIDFAVQR